jgi:hypothetical protein
MKIILLTKPAGNIAFAKAGQDIGTSTKAK